MHLHGSLIPWHTPVKLAFLGAFLLFCGVSDPLVSPLQKLLAEAKTRSLQGEKMPGYEDDTLEPRDQLSPRASLARMPHPFGEDEEEGGGK